MKSLKYISIIFAIIIFGLISEVKAQKPKEIFEQANFYYNEGVYDTAIILYESILDKDLISSALLYNLGNAYYKSGNYPKAILNYEKALKISPNDEDIKTNLAMANLFITDKIEAVPQVFLKTWWINISNWFSINQWATISLILLGLTLTLVFLYLTTKTAWIKKTAFFSIILCILLCICSFTISAQKYNDAYKFEEGIIISSTITIKSSPSATSVDLFVLHEGTKVEILDNIDGWEKIKIANGNTGWLPSNSVIKF